MKIFVLILSFALVAFPCLAGDVAAQGRPMLMAAAKDKRDHGDPPGGKVVIKGKAGKVTDVDKKPKKKDEKKSK